MVEAEGCGVAFSTSGSSARFAHRFVGYLRLAASFPEAVNKYPPLSFPCCLSDEVSYFLAPLPLFVCLVS